MLSEFIAFIFLNFIFKERFVEEVHGSGVLVYLSATWLSELYQQVLACNLLEKCGYNPSSTENNALVNVLTGMQYCIKIFFTVK